MPLSQPEKRQVSLAPGTVLCEVERSTMTTIKQKKHSCASRSTVKTMLDHLRQSPAWKRRRRAAQEFFRRWLKEVDDWKKRPRYLGVTFPGVKDGDRLAEELVQFARDVVAGRR